MWEAVKHFASSPGFWGATLYLVLGAVIGALVSVSYSLRAHRPKLIISGGGGGGTANRRSWHITIANRPSFLNKPLDGESARDVHANLRADEAKSQSYTVYWGGQREDRATIEPGQSRPLELFHWERGVGGYCVVDASGEPVARFQDRERKFMLTLNDRLGRRTSFFFSVEFDDTHLKNSPRLNIRHPMTLRRRWQIARGGLQELAAAFRVR